MGRRELTVRGLARTLAEQRHYDRAARPQESMRRTLNKYLHEGVQPSAGMRDALADAFGVDPSEVPSADDEEEDMAATLHALVQAHPRLARDLARVVKELQRA